MHTTIHLYYIPLSVIHFYRKFSFYFATSSFFILRNAKNIYHDIHSAALLLRLSHSISSKISTLSKVTYNWNNNLWRRKNPFTYFSIASPAVLLLILRLSCTNQRWPEKPFFCGSLEFLVARKQWQYLVCWGGSLWRMYMCSGVTGNRTEDGH